MRIIDFCKKFSCPSGRARFRTSWRTGKIAASQLDWCSASKHFLRPGDENLNFARATTLQCSMIILPKIFLLRVFVWSYSNGRVCAQRNVRAPPSPLHPHSFTPSNSYSRVAVTLRYFWGAQTQRQDRVVSLDLIFFETTPSLDPCLKSPQKWMLKLSRFSQSTTPS